VKTTIRYSNIHDAGRLPDDPQFTCTMIPPLDKRTLRTITWMIKMTNNQPTRRTNRRMKE
jgi:hypothetical protein